jgi:hypothetical protein
MGKRIETDTAFQQALSLLERMSDFNIEPNKIRWVNGSLSVARTALSVASAVGGLTALSVASADSVVAPYIA